MRDVNSYITFEVTFKIKHPHKVDEEELNDSIKSAKKHTLNYAISHFGRQVIDVEAIKSVILKPLHRKVRKK